MGLIKKIFSGGDAKGKNDTLEESVKNVKDKKEFYVYEWIIKSTREIFYVGKGYGDQYKGFHEFAYKAEKIRETYDTEYIFVKTGLTAPEANQIESDEMIRILNKTNFCLTNCITPLFTDRDNGYKPSSNTPSLQFETAPYIYALEIDEHYFGKRAKNFDTVDYNNLKNVVFIETGIVPDIINVLYGGSYERYYNDVVSILNANGNRVIKSKFAQSVTSWIYVSNEDIVDYETEQYHAIKRLGHKIPTYHLIDVWKFLTNRFGQGISDNINELDLKVKAKHNRCGLLEIKNTDNWEKGFHDGYHYWEKGEEERKADNLDQAILLFDKARYNGYLAPMLYDSYALLYRKNRDYENEIEILNEGILRFRDIQGESYDKVLIRWENRKRIAIKKLEKA